MLKSLAFGFLVVMSSLFVNSDYVVAKENESCTTQNRESDIWYLYSNEDGTFWLEYGEEMDVVTHINYEDLEKWNINEDKLKYGFMLNSVMDNDYNVLRVKGNKQVEMKMIPNEVRQSIDENIAYELSDDKRIELDVFYMYSNEVGSYWLDPATSEGENVIFVGFDDLKEWNIDLDDLEHGQKWIGVFSEDGWELFGLKWIY